MEEKIKISILLEIYGKLLTEKQNEYMEYYYNEDLSLSEIADNDGITRQAVREIIVKSKNKLEEYENKLQLMKKRKQISEKIQEMKKDIEDEKTKEKLQEIQEIMNN